MTTKLTVGQTIYVPDFQTNTILVRKVLGFTDDPGYGREKEECFQYNFRDETVQTPRVSQVDVHAIFTTVEKAQEAFERAREAHLSAAERELGAVQRKIQRILGKVPVITDTIGTYREIEIAGKQKVALK